MSRIAVIQVGEDIMEGDKRYFARELLENPVDGHLPDLTKADIYSLGATIYELMIGEEMPMGGDEWHEIREDKLPKLQRLTG